MKGMLSSILLVSCLLLSAAAQASVARCEGCSEAQFRQMAINLRTGRHVISSLSTNQIRMYEVYFERDLHRSDPNYGWQAIPVTVPPDIQEAFVVARDFYVLTAGSNAYVVTVDGGSLGVQGLHDATAYDVMTDINLKGRLGDRLTRELPDTSDAVNRMILQIAAGGLAFIGVGDASIKIVVVLADGSTVTYEFTPADITTADYQEGQSRTEGGQVIPESNSADNTGTWYGNGEDLSGLLNYLNEIGATTSGTGSGTIIMRMDCSWDGQALNCIVTYTFE